MEITQELGHYSRIIAGLESVHEHICYNAGIDVDGTYALEVLKLHANDMGEVEGTEGFLDTVKKGAKDIVKWIREIIAAIGRFITGKKKEEPVWRDSWSEINKEEVNKSLTDLYGRALDAIIKHISDDQFEQVRPYFKFMDLDQINEKATKVREELRQTSGIRHADLFTQVRELSRMITGEMDRVNKAISALDLKAPGVGAAANKLTALAGALGKASEVLMSAWHKHTDTIMMADRRTTIKDNEQRYDSMFGKK